MEMAERIAIKEHGSIKIAVISGVGTRNYYRKMGYELEGPYMVKYLVSGIYRSVFECTDEIMPFKISKESTNCDIKVDSLHNNVNNWKMSNKLSDKEFLLKIDKENGREIDLEYYETIGNRRNLFLF